MNDERHEILIARIVEGEARPADWDALFGAADREPALWRQVVESQRDQSELLRLMERAEGVASGVAAPVVAARVSASTPATGMPREAIEADAPLIEVPRRSFGAVPGWAGWTGWAVAAVLVLAWSVTLALRGGPAARSTDVQSPVARTPVVDAPIEGRSIGAPAVPTVPVASARDAFQSYLDRGREEGLVLSREPRRLLLETRPNPSGPGFELIYLQQVMERAVVPDLFQFGDLDEHGRPSLVRYDHPVRGRM